MKKNILHNIAKKSTSWSKKKKYIILIKLKKPQIIIYLNQSSGINYFLKNKKAAKYKEHRNTEMPICTEV